MLRCQSFNHSNSARRAGFLAPAIVVALLAVMLAFALVLDRLWLRNTAVEMDAALESGALAAGRALVSDNSLRRGASIPLSVDRARSRAIAAAAQNRVGGDALIVDQKDVVFGRWVRNAKTGSRRFLETNSRPTTVQVTARRNRRYGNPVGAFLNQFAGNTTAEVVRRAEVRLDNRVAGVRPFAGVNAPLWPLAILESRSSGLPSNVQTWHTQIDERSGFDRFTYDESSRRVSAGPDGIPEITLSCPPPRANEAQRKKRNVCLFNLGNGFRQLTIRRQFERGITRDDLRRFPDRMLSFKHGPLTLQSYDNVPQATRTQLRRQIGRCRMLLLYHELEPSGDSGFGRVACRRLVGGRIVSVRELPDRSGEIIVQPGTLTSRTAVLTSDRRFANPFIFKLQLAR